MKCALVAILVTIFGVHCAPDLLDVGNIHLGIGGDDDKTVKKDGDTAGFNLGPLKLHIGGMDEEIYSQIQNFSGISKRNLFRRKKK